MAGPRAHARGFTMVELVMVLVVMGVLAAVALPRLTDRRALQERGFLDQVRSLLQHSRKIATVQRRDVCVLLTPAAVSAVYAAGAACNPAAPLPTPGSTDPFAIAVPSGVVLGGVAQVRFSLTGQPVPNVDHVVTIGGNTYRVSRETGIVY